jgi:diphthamide synthase (EF-2-diphthine--ammonia ligase)
MTESIPCQPTTKRILLSWSGGKDSTWALNLLHQQPEYEVAALVTTINPQFQRVAMHGFSEDLLDLQAASIGLPLWKVNLPFPCSNNEYESRMAVVCARAGAEGLLAVLPPAVAPCSERVEFHSFSFAGPIFSRTISVIPGQRVTRDNFTYADLLPTTVSAGPHA